MTMYNSLVGSSVDNCSEVAKVGVLCRAPQCGLVAFLWISFPPSLVAGIVAMPVFSCFLFYPNVSYVRGYRGDQGTGMKESQHRDTWKQRRSAAYSCMISACRPP